MTIPIAPILGFVGAPAIRGAIDSILKGDFDQAILNARHLIGITYEGSFDPKYLFDNLTPIVAGLLIHKFVGGPPLNFNRMLGRAKVPFLRI